MAYTTYPHLCDREKLRVFFILSKVSDKSEKTFTTAVQAETPDEAIAILWKEQGTRNVVNPIVFSGFDFDCVNHELVALDYDVRPTDKDKEQFVLLERNPVNLSAMLEFVRDEFGESLTPTEKKSLRSIRKKVATSMGL